MSNKKQVLVIHGGSTFNDYQEYERDLINKEIKLERIRFSKGWKSSLQEELGDKYDVLTPSMPNKDNANYHHWKIVFEKVLDNLDKEVIIIGHSLGGIFLAKYLSENNIDKQVTQLHLVAAPFYADDLNESLGHFILNPNLLGTIEECVDRIFVYHSVDDTIVPYVHSKKYIEYMNKSEMFELQDRVHIWQEEFPELIKNITNENCE